MTALSSRLPWLRPLAVARHRVRRRIAWWRSDAAWARERTARSLPERVARHDSLLLRTLVGVPPQLQQGKVVNLRLAAARLDGLVLAPGETLSFNRVVGSCSRRRGYVAGLRLSGGRPVAGVGGGICQLANLLHWLVLHSPLTVVERSEHSVDAFPDQERVVPWGVGCTIVYNYVDLVIRNDTAATFQLRTWVGPTHLHGELRADRPLPDAYRVTARHEEFVLLDGVVHRRNEIWRTLTPRSGGAPTEELVRRTCARVAYDVDQATIRPRSTTRFGA